jgi:hypothetical protein
MSRQNPSPMRSDHVRTAARHWLGIVRQPPRRASALAPVPPRARSGRASSVSCEACWTPPSKHTCSYGWAVVPTSIEHTSELDDSRSRRLTLGRRSLTHGRSRRDHVVAFGSSPSSDSGVSLATRGAPAFRARRGWDTSGEMHAATEEQVSGEWFRAAEREPNGATSNTILGRCRRSTRRLVVMRACFA